MSHWRSQPFYNEPLCPAKPLEKSLNLLLLPGRFAATIGGWVRLSPWKRYWIYHQYHHCSRTTLFFCCPSRLLLPNTTQMLPPCCCSGAPDWEEDWGELLKCICGMRDVDQDLFSGVGVEVRSKCWSAAFREREWEIEREREIRHWICWKLSLFSLQRWLSLHILEI